MGTNTKAQFAHVPGDLLGGLTAAIVALPISLAFGVASGLGPAAGLYGAICCGMAAVFGGTKTHVSGPTGPMTVVVAAMVGAATGHTELVFASIILAGLFQIALGLLKAGRYIEYVSYPVISGFMSGVGIIIVILQLRPLVGLASKGDVIGTLQTLPEILQSCNQQAFGLGLICLACIYAVPLINKRIPAPLVALTVGSMAAVTLQLNIPTISQIPAGLPHPVIPMIPVAAWHTVITNALALAILGSIDSLLTSVIADRLTRTKHDSNRELIGQGIGNLTSGLVGGMAGAGATMRTVVNIRSGGTTRLSGFTHGVILLAVLLGLGPLAQKIPLACLAAILITVGISIIDYKAIKLMRKAPKEDVIVLAVVLFATVFVDLIVAVGAGLAVTALLFAKKMSDIESMHVTPLQDISDAHPVVSSLSEDAQNQIIVYSFHGPLFFGEVTNLEKLLNKVPGAKYVILHFANVPFADMSGAIALQDALNHWASENIDVLVVKLFEPTRATLANLGVQLPHSHGTVNDALAHIAFGNTQQQLELAAVAVEHES